MFAKPIVLSSLGVLAFGLSPAPTAQPKLDESPLPEATGAPPGGCLMIQDPEWVIIYDAQAKKLVAMRKNASDEHGAPFTKVIDITKVQN